MSKDVYKPLLNDVTIEITNRCQLRCQHCGIWAEKETYEMGASLIIRMLKELLNRYRIYFISITGGEPFLHKHLDRILKALALFRERKIITGFGVYSNAACLGKIQSLLSVHGNDLRGMKMGISIDGNEKTHDRLRGLGAYQKTLASIQWIKENFDTDIILELKFTINHMNYAEIGKVYELARRFKARFSPKFMETGVSGYYHRCEISKPEDLALLTPNMIEVIQRQISEILEDEYDGIDHELIKAMMVLLINGKDRIRACATPARSLFITSRRLVYPCLYLPASGTVSLDGKLPEALDSTRKKYAHDAAQGNCPRCLAYHGFLKDFNLEYLER